ncbi:MAG: chromate resistance protein, partial [Cyanobacteria bacterium REEB65]|nr:chromate resistance protein [Cyanobacteria bacterium REEB65]
FHEARNADYDQLADDARTLLDKLADRATLESDGRLRLEAEGARLKRRLADVERIDFFAAPKGEVAREAVSECLMRLKPTPGKGHDVPKDAEMKVRGQVWVTRVGVKVDRIASAWLIRRFIDPEARFEFAPAHGYVPKPGEIRFDMFEAEYTHEGDECTFEVLLRKLGPDDAALRALAEIVHDIDVKDGKFGRPETPGLERMLAAIALHPRDEVRIERGSAVLDDLYALFGQSSD